MKHISDLFSRYQNKIKPPQSSIVKVFIAICEEETGFQLKEEQCSYSPTTKTIHLKTPSVLKSELLQKKDDLLRRLKIQLGVNAPEQIL